MGQSQPGVNLAFAAVSPMNQTQDLRHLQVQLLSLLFHSAFSLLPLYRLDGVARARPSILIRSLRAWFKRTAGVPP